MKGTQTQGREAVKLSADELRHAGYQPINSLPGWQRAKGSGARSWWTRRYMRRHQDFLFVYNPTGRYRTWFKPPTNDIPKESAPSPKEAQLPLQVSFETLVRAYETAVEQIAILAKELHLHDEMLKTSEDNNRKLRQALEEERERSKQFSMLRPATLSERARRHLNTVTTK